MEAAILTSQAITHQEKVHRLLKQRLEIQYQAQNNPEFQAVCRAIAAKDIIWFCNNFVTTFNPRVKPSILPFILFPRQEECIRWLLACYENGEWGAVVKCRYTGLSWISCVILTHKLLFENDFTGILASNKAELVDKIGDPKTLFAKILMILNWLPNWMQPIDLKRYRKRGLIINPQKNSTVGAESGANIGRGGRSSLAVIDEFAHVEQDESAISALSENTDCAIFISTPKGTANKFYELASNSEIQTFYYRWEADPRRTLKWRERQTIKLGEAIAAQELDCDFNAAVEGVYIESKWVIACINAHEKIPELQRSGYIQAGLDIGVTNDDSVLAYKDGAILTIRDVLPKQEVTQTALLVNSLLQEDNVDVLTYDADGIGRDVSGTLDQLEDTPDYSINRFHGSGKTSDRYWDEFEATSKDLFYNKRAEAWGYLRWLIFNTYKHINGIQEFNPEDMISLPDDPLLITDLSKPTRKYRGSKILLESKADMQKRGIKSPNHGDAAAYACYESNNLDWLSEV